MRIAIGSAILAVVAHQRSGQVRAWTLEILRGLRRYSGMLSAVLLISLGSKILGLIREVYISSHFGVSSLTDAFFGVQQLPVIMMSYMAGAFTLAFVPHYVAVKEQGQHIRFLRNLLVAVMLFSVALTLLMIAGASNLVPLVIGFHTEIQLIARYSIVLSAAVLPSALIGIAYSICHAERQHSKAMLLSTVGPAAMLISLLAWDRWPNSDLKYALPWSYVIGTLVAGFWSFRRISAAFAHVDVARAVFDKPCPSGFKFIQQLSAASIENVAFSLNQLLTVHFAAATGAGGVTFNAYALRIAMLPLSGAATPLNQIVNTWLARQRVTEQKQAFIKALFLSVAAYSACALLMFALRHRIVSLVYQRGVFSAFDAASVVQALSPYAIYFVIMALNQLFARFFFVVGKGQVYTAVLLAGYGVANFLKPIGAAHFGLSGVISAGVVGEAMATVALAILFVCYNARSQAWTTN